jgi:hypothetical protein
MWDETNTQGPPPGPVERVAGVLWLLVYLAATAWTYAFVRENMWPWQHGEWT